MSWLPTDRPSKRRTALKHGPFLLFYAYLFFLSIAAMGEGMKVSFKDALKTYLLENAANFDELVSFVIGILGTSLVQSSSTVTAMAVVLTQEAIVPLIISVGIVHGANLGTSVTSSLVAFAAETQAMSGNPLRDLRALLFQKRRPGFHRAVSTAVVHGLFNAIMVTMILLALELPFGIIHHASEATAGTIGALAARGGPVVEVLEWISPTTWTKPVVMLGLDAGLPGWSIVLAGFGFLFWSLKGFSRTMKSIVLFDTHEEDIGRTVEILGHRLLGKTPFDTFVRGLVLTFLVQSSSATTSMVVPFAAMGFFSVRKVFPFILGANIGTTATALLAAASAIGQPGFEAGMTIALSHFYLNVLAVVLVVAIPPLRTSILGLTEWLADAAARAPVALLGYLFTMSVVVPAVVYFLPLQLAWAALGALVAVLIVGPHFYLRKKRRNGQVIYAMQTRVREEDAEAA